MSSLPALPMLVSAQDKDASLQAALSRMVAQDGLSLTEVLDAGASTALAPEGDDPHVTAIRRLPPVAAEYAPFPDAIDARLVAALRARGIDQLYTHQAASIAHALAGRHTVIVTPTASGKTLCYNAPVLSAILQNPSTRALYLFPTKALAQDQLAELHAAGATGQLAGRSRPDSGTL